MSQNLELAIIHRLPPAHRKQIFSFVTKLTVKQSNPDGFRQIKAGEQHVPLLSSDELQGVSIASAQNAAEEVRSWSTQAGLNVAACTLGTKVAEECGLAVVPIIVGQEALQAERAELGRRLHLELEEREIGLTLATIRSGPGYEENMLALNTGLASGLQVSLYPLEYDRR